MTWPMHDAGPTTPDPGRDEPPDGQPRQDEPWPGEQWRDEPGSAEGAAARRGRHAAPDPLPPMEGPMPGGGPSPAETTLPLALQWPAPPKPPRSPRTAPPGSPVPPGSPAGWRRVPRPADQPAAGRTQPLYPPPGYRPVDPHAPSRRPGPAGPPAEPAGRRGPGGPETAAVDARRAS